jgi:hypothetical protein
MARTPGPQNKKTQQPSHEEIAKRATQIFEQSGRKPDRDMENWLAAETQLIKEHDAQNQPAHSDKLQARPAHRETVHSRA